MTDQRLEQSDADREEYDRAMVESHQELDKVRDVEREAGPGHKSPTPPDDGQETGHRPASPPSLTPDVIAVGDWSIALDLLHETAKILRAGALRSEAGQPLDDNDGHDFWSATGVARGAIGALIESSRALDAARAEAARLKKQVETEIGKRHEAEEDDHQQWKQNVELRALLARCQGVIHSIVGGRKGSLGGIDDSYVGATFRRERMDALTRDLARLLDTKETP